MSDNIENYCSYLSRTQVTRFYAVSIIQPMFRTHIGHRSPLRDGQTGELWGHFNEKKVIPPQKSKSAKKEIIFGLPLKG